MRVTEDAVQVRDGRHPALKITWEEREQIAQRNRARREDDLLNRRLVFASGPYEAHVQYSNFCNMSCVMCWDGDNPPLLKMSPRVLERLESQIAPSLSVITPHDGSEPLVVTWDETRRIAHDHSIRLALTTNTQYLDEKKFAELKDIVEMVVMSIDSHVPEVFEKIRPGSRPDKVFENLRTTARLCREQDLECIVQVVFMTLNAPMLPETVSYMADIGVPTVNVIQMIDINRRSNHLDPTLHYSADWIEWIKQSCIAVAKEKQIRLGWDLAGVEWFDFREMETRVQPRPSKIQNDRWDERMKLHVPGFCKYAYNRLRISADGDVAPCGQATEGELSLGNLEVQDFEEIWNGPSARDLRRAHYTWDYPSTCESCRYSDPVGSKPTLPFIEVALRRMGQPDHKVESQIEIDEPVHMARQTEAPRIRIRGPERRAARYFVSLALGGQAENVEIREIGPLEHSNGALEFAFPEDLWHRMESNLGYWWTVLGSSPDTHVPHLRSREVRCLIRHEDIPRVAGSNLGYPDQGHLPVAYLGGSRQVGWQDPDDPPARPRLRRHAKPNGAPPWEYDARPPSMDETRTDPLTRTRELVTGADELLGPEGHHRVLWQHWHQDSEEPSLRFAEGANGYELLDSTGRSFVDWVGGGGPVVLGYRHPAVEEAIRSQLEAGPLLTLMHPVEVEVASLLVEMIPCAEMAAFGKNGSDALAAAIRLARAATGKEMLLQYGMHGFHEWFACLAPGVRGIPEALRSLVHPFPYNDLDALGELFERFEGNVAAVVMEPMRDTLPEPGYLEEVQALAHGNGSLLVFDEMVTGIRLANGGAQELFGVVPDLACFGKAIANGMPLSAVVGRRDYMRHLPSVAYGMTFRGETLSLATARAVLRLLREEPVAERLAQTGAEVRKALQRASASENVYCELIGPDARMSFAFRDEGVIPEERVRALFLAECANHGVLTNGNILPSIAHDAEAVDRTATAFSKALRQVAELSERGREVVAEAIRAGFSAASSNGSGGSPGQPPAGFIDSVRKEEGRLVVDGWMLVEEGVPEAVEFVSNTGAVVEAETTERRDVAQLYAATPGAEDSGFIASLPDEVFCQKGDYGFTLRARRADEVVFRCQVIRPGKQRRLSAADPHLTGDGVLYL